MRFFPILGAGLFAFFLFEKSTAQQLSPARPISKSPFFEKKFNEKPAPSVNLAAPPDAFQPEKFDGSPIVALPMLSNISIKKDGEWMELPGGDRVWRIEVGATGAAGLILIFEKFKLPAGAQFFVFNKEKTQQIGAFTDKSCLASGKMTIGPIRGERAILELYEPISQKNQSEIELPRVDFVFDKSVFAASGQVASSADFGESLACHININCSQAAGFEVEKKAVARVMMVLAQGTGFCTGTLLNQPTADKKPYLLTGYHCKDGYTPLYDQWKFDFNYEGAACTNPANEPVPQSVVGCTFKSGRQATDFLLLELDKVPYTYSIYYAGWNRSATDLASSSVFVHHPRGDVKKWSKDNQAAVVYAATISWNNNVISPNNSHFNTVTDLGTYEPGSSGCALFDQNKRVVGNLHGGNTTNLGCTVSQAWFGRFALSWDAGTTLPTRLREWIDPGLTNVMTMDGYEPPVLQPITISGNVKTAWDLPMPNTKIILSGGLTDTVLTNAAGDFSFIADPNKTYQIRPERDTADLNGISTFDMVDMAKHTLNIITFGANGHKFMASDINRNNNVTTFDIVELRKLVLGTYPDLPANTSWRFVKADYVFPDPPLTANLPESIEVIATTTSVQNINFIGVKVGDANFSADPTY